MDLSFLPAVNACLNATAAVLLVWGRRLARAGRREEHRRVMLTAFAVSSFFLFFYVLHKWSKDFTNTAFEAEGLGLLLYRAMLFSHVTLAITVPFFAITLVVLGSRDHIDRHRRVARVAWPIWMYVSLTGIAIYLLLYHVNPLLA